MMKFRDLFADKPVNTGRQNALDLSKAFPILCLPFVHTFIECTTDAGLGHGIPYLFDSIIGGPFSAPMWMFAMGIGILYTRHNATRDMIKRGLTIIGFFFLLNTCRFLIPYLIGYGITGDRGQFIEPLLYRFFGNDILFFAGFALIVIALMRHAKIPMWGMFTIALAMSVISTVIGDFDVHNPLGNIFLGYIVGTEDAAGLVISDFPLMRWLIIPMSGYVFGSFLIRAKEEKRFYALVAPIPALIAAIYLPIGIRNEWGMFGPGQNCYYHMSTFDVFISVCLTIGMLGLWYVISLHLPNRITRFMCGISRSITPFYCIHWIFVRWITNLILYVVRGTQILPVGVTFLLALAITIVTIPLCRWWRHFKEKRRRLVSL